jgi:CMP-N-acetylneuraminic acid synthetase
VPDKNLRPLAGRTLLDYTAAAIRDSGVVDRAVLSTDSAAIAAAGRAAGLEAPFMRPAALAQDDTPMLPVLRHAIDQMTHAGWTPEFVVLLQPTSPLRRPSHVRDALERLRRTGADSVITVVEVPKHLSPDYVMRIDGDVLRPFLPDGAQITRRQDARPAYARDGTVYAFRRDTIERFGNIYGVDCRPFLIEASESLSIDTPQDWADAERILAAREAGGQVGR